MGSVADLRVAVVGLGPMGRGIARAFAAAGAEVMVVDVDAEATSAGLDRLVAEADRDGAPVAVKPSELAPAAASADLLIEAVVEDMAVKRALLEQVAAFARDDLVVASNTSSLSVGEMGRAFGEPGRVVGMHFFNPPTRMRLVEVVRGPRTAESTVELAVDWVAALGKTAVVCADSPNFVVNRICRPLYYEAQLLRSQGVAPGVVDTVARAALGHRMGPLELLDFTGLHTHLASSETALREFGDPRYRPIPPVRSLVRAGATGRAAGRGFYDHAALGPADARAAVLRPAPSAVDIAVAVTGPGAARLRPLFPTEVPEAAVVVYSGSSAADVADLVATGRTVVVESSAGVWVDALPDGVGWLRLHRPPGPSATPFAEVVDDPVARIAATPAVETVLAAARVESVVVPALAGLVADRLQYCMVNEAAAVVEEGTAEREAVDLALRLGMNHPRGPLEYLAEVGPAPVLAGLLDLQEWFGDPRYRPAPLLRRMAAGAARAES